MVISCSHLPQLGSSTAPAKWHGSHPKRSLSLLALEEPWVFSGWEAEDGSKVTRSGPPSDVCWCVNLPVVPHKAVAKVSKIGNL